VLVRFPLEGQTQKALPLRLLRQQLMLPLRFCLNFA
jgi:hypothetical protein